MTVYTDSARELIDLVAALATSNRQERGDKVLADNFNVTPWSYEFFQVLTAISSRIDEVRGALLSLGYDEDFRQTIDAALVQVNNAFSAAGMVNTWDHSLANFLVPAHLSPLMALSPLLRTARPIPKLTDEELEAAIAEATQLLEWLQAHQLEERDFIRQALIEGISAFLFRAERLKWVGWGYTVQSLREVVGAYLALQHGFPDPAKTPKAGAMILKVGAAMKSISEKVGVAKDGVENAQWLLSIFGAGIKLLPHIGTGVAGYIAGAGG